MLAGHSALGLAFAALIYLVCFSGSIAVFTQEFTRWEQPAGPVLHRGVSPQAADARLPRRPWPRIPRPTTLHPPARAGRVRA
jgi:uncharacterized iron-regulated membrane protein